MFDKLGMYLQYPFVRYALIVGVLIALCSSLLGVTLVLKRFSFIGDGLSHVAFGAMAIAAVLNLTNEMLLVLSIGIAVIFILFYNKIFALVIFPALSAMRLFRSFKMVTICTAVDVVAFILCYLAGKITGGVRK